jgi:hypothetical protein
MSSGATSLPGIYNAVKDFYTIPTKQKHIFKIRNEKDHLFHINDYVDFVTSPEAEDAVKKGLESVENETVYSFNSLDARGDISISSEVGTDYFVYGLSFVKIENTITIMAVLGKLVEDIMLESVPLEKTMFSALHPNKEIREAKERLYQNIKNKHCFEKEVPITKVVPEEENVQSCLAIIRIDATTKKVINRYLYEETEAQYIGLTDDDAEGLKEESMDEIQEELDRHRGVFDLCMTAPALLTYFDFKYQLVKNDVIVAQYGKRHPELVKRFEKKDLSEKERRMRKYILKRVSALRIVKEAVPLRKYIPPQYIVMVSGFYRKLPRPESKGKDENGNEITGATWVKSHDRWKDRKERRKEVLIKSRLSIARSIVENYELANEILESTPINSNIALGKEIKEKAETQTAFSRAQQFQERAKLTAAVRYAVFNRDDFRCVLCGADAATERDIKLHVDHIMPVSKGGKTVMNNLRTLCSRCNIGKSDSIG